jgi:DNA-binding MarR family transcriptional regulator
VKKSTMTARKRDAQRRAETGTLAAQMERDLSAIRRAMRKPLEAEFAKGGLTLPQKVVMQAVVGSQGISLKDLSRQVSLAHSTVSGIVDRLEKRGMVERRPDSADGRISRIHPSAAVAAFLSERMPALAAGPLDAALMRATEAERGRLAKSLRRLRELLEAG